LPPQTIRKAFSQENAEHQQQNLAKTQGKTDKEHFLEI